jgi:hypothetical protein
MTRIRCYPSKEQKVRGWGPPPPLRVKGVRISVCLSTKRLGGRWMFGRSDVVTVVLPRQPVHLTQGLRICTELLHLAAKQPSGICGGFGGC